MALKPMLYILNSKQRVIGVASNDSPKALPYFEDNLIESIETGVVTYEFAVPAKHKDSKNLVASNHVIVRDLDGNFLLFTIREVAELHEDGRLIKRVFCENTAVGEMLGQVVAPQKIASATLANAIKTIFLGVDEWSVLEIPYTLAKDVEIKEHMNLLEVLNYLTDLYEMEMFFAVELANVHIKRKIVRFVKKRGQDTNIRFEYGLNLTGVTRKEDSTGVITALYGIGKGEGNEAISLKNYKHEDDGNFYHLAMTEWVGSKEAVSRWGRKGQHVFGIYKSDKADTVEQLYKETLAELKRRVNPVLTYEASVVTMERITGYSGQKVRVGDRVLVIDKTFNPVIVLEARVIELQRSFTNPMEDGVKLGEYRPLQPSFSKLLKKVQDSTNQAVKYPDLPKIQQDFTDEVIKPIKTVVDEMEEEVEEAVKQVVDIKKAMDEVSAGYEDIKEVIKDVKIYKQDTPPTGVSIDTLWINTSEKPNFMYRWDGTAWQPLSPATAEDIGAIGNDFFNEKMEEINGETAKINAAIKATDGKVATMQTDLTSKVDATWVNGQLVSKANVGDSYTKKESDNALNGKVSTTTYTTDKNGIITRLDSAETRVTQTEDKIKLTATKDELTQASDGLTSKINKINSDLTVQAGLIESKVSNDTYTTDKAANTTRFTNAESRITQTENAVKLKVNAEDVYKKTEVDSRVNAKVDTTVYNNKIASIEATNSSITQKVEEVKSTVTNLSAGGRNVLFNTGNFSDTLGWVLNSGTSIAVVNKDGFNVIKGVGSYMQVGNKTKLKPDTEYVYSGEIMFEQDFPINDANPLHCWVANGGASHSVPKTVVSKDKVVKANTWTRIVIRFKTLATGETTFTPIIYTGATMNADKVVSYLKNIQLEEGNVATSWTPAPEDTDTQINAKVNTEDYNKKVAEIKVTTDGISQTVSDVNKTVSAQGTRLSTAESAITQANTQIGLKVNSTDVYKKAEVDGKVNAKVDTTTYNSKIAELKITTDKITQSVSETNTKIDGISIGGNNFYKQKSFTASGGTTIAYDGNNKWWTITIPTTATGSWKGMMYNAKNAILSAGRTYTISYEIYADEVIPTAVDVNNFGVTTVTGTNDNDVVAKRINRLPKTIAKQWVKASVTFTMPDNATQDFYDNSVLGVGGGWNPTKTTIIKIRKMQIEEGSIPTDFSVSQEDTDETINSKVATTTYNSKMASIDTSISGITQRVTNTESTTTGLGNRISTAEATIKTHSGQISSKVESTTYNTGMNGLKSRVSTAETWINQTKTDITFLAKKNEVGSLLNQSPDGFKILGKYLDISGLVTFSTFDTATQAKINAIDTKAGDGVSKANAAQSTANTANSTANTANGTANAVKGKTDGWTINTTQINGGKIATDTITALQLNINEIFGNSAVIGKITSYNISADRITAGTIKGIKYESINATNPKIKLVLEGNTVKSYGASDGTKQNYAELKEGLVRVFEVAESGSPFGDKATAIQPSAVTVTQGSRNTKVFPTNIEFSVGAVKSTIDFEGLSTGSGAGLMIVTESGIEIHGKNADEPAIQFQNYQSAIINGWGNIVGNPNSNNAATWSIKDADGRVKFLTGIGKGAGQSTEINSYTGGIVFNHNGSRALSTWIQGANYMLQFGGKAILKWQDTQKRFEFRTADDSNWTNAAAGSFQNASSLKWKTDIKNYEDNATDIIANSNIMTFKMKPSENQETNEIVDTSTLPTHIGLIAEFAPKEIQAAEGSAVDLYAMISVAWKSIQELKTEINEIKAENALLKDRLVGTNN